jgi:NADPH2:quinone reductase
VKAIRVHAHGGREELQLEQVADPRPGSGEVLVQIEAAGINFVEVYQRKGQYSMSLPYMPGSEGAGTVVALGEGVAAELMRDGAMQILDAVRLSQGPVEGSY